MIISCVHERLEEKGITPYRAAKDLGLSETTFSKIKQGNRLFSPKNLAKICEYLSVQPGDLFIYKED